jgi:hypothetical protein
MANPAVPTQNRFANSKGGKTCASEPFLPNVGDARDPEAISDKSPLIGAPSCSATCSFYRTERFFLSKIRDKEFVTGEHGR